MAEDLLNIVGQWFKNYHGTKYESELEANINRNSAAERANRLDDTKIPEEAINAINVAAGIVGLDKKASGNQQDPETLKKNLKYIGQMESEYNTKEQVGGGPAKSYWQVEPETAMDIIKNSKPYFGPKFEEHFSKRYGSNVYDTLSKMDSNQMSEVLLNDDELSATFAGMKVNSTYD